MMETWLLVILKQLKSQAKATLALSADDYKVVISSQLKPHCTLAQLLAASDYTQVDPQEDQE